MHMTFVHCHLPLSTLPVVVKANQMNDLLLVILLNGSMITHSNCGLHLVITAGNAICVALDTKRRSFGVMFENEKRFKCIHINVVIKDVKQQLAISMNFSQQVMLIIYQTQKKCAVRRLASCRWATT